MRWHISRVARGRKLLVVESKHVNSCTDECGFCTPLVSRRHRAKSIKVARAVIKLDSKRVMILKLGDTDFVENWWRRSIMAKPEKIIQMSVDEYLRFEEAATVRHEFIDGEVFEMTGGTLAHNLIGGNILTVLRTELRGSGCRVYIEAVKVHIESSNCFYYPDVVVDCCRHNDSSTFTTTPVIIFEVLSRSTAATDRREKRIAYKKLATLEAYVLVHQARKCVEVFRKEGDDWTVQIFQTGSFELDCIPNKTISINLEQIYEDLDPENDLNLRVQEDVEDYVTSRS
jgi:Uma2 family endonuclease